jgi:PPK2 family polyphosphate:nucleotide phosphotransferase
MPRLKTQPLVPTFGEAIRLADFDPGYTGDYEDEQAIHEQLMSDLQKLDILQERLYAEGQQSLLIIVQAMDTGGKDGLIKHVFRGLNPAGVRVTSFKAPSLTDLAHDFLWRVHPHAPPKGMIGIFNRSHYEDVLIVRVHDLVPKKRWRERYGHINDFEELLAEQGTTILKFFLHISKKEQKRRLQDRLDEPEKHWKFNAGDLRERALWDDYMAAYEDAINKCHKRHAPWHIVPANKKWYRNYVVTRAVVEALEAMNPQFPPPPPDLDFSQVVIPD